MKPFCLLTNNPKTNIMARKILKIICLTMVLSVFMPPKLIKLMAASSESFSPSFQTVSLEEALKKLEEKFHVSIAYRSGLLKNNQIDMSVLQHASTIEAALSSALADRKLSFKKNNDRFFVIIEKNIPSEIAAVQSKPVKVQQRSVRGVVTDEQGQPIPFAAVKIKGTTLVTSTNEKGQFVINNLPPDAI